MALIRIGDRGAQVSQLQQSLNARPSRLQRLIVDGVFGPKTHARVIEFQRDNGLLPDGIVGGLTSGKLRGGALPQVDVNAVMYQLARQLNFIQQAAFLSTARPLIADRNLLANSIALEAIIVLLILLFFAALLIQSSNKANQEAGRELNRKVNRLRDRLRDDPSEAPAVSSEALKEARDQARKLAQRAREEREKCFDKFTPEQLAKKLKDCEKLIAAVTTAIQSLLQKANGPTGGGIKPENLIKGISASAAALITALRELATCMGCDNLLF